MHLACICLRVKGSLPGSSACTPVFSESLQWCLTSQQHPWSAQCPLLVRAPCTFRAFMGDPKLACPVPPDFPSL